MLKEKIGRVIIKLCCFYITVYLDKNCRKFKTKALKVQSKILEKESKIKIYFKSALPLMRDVILLIIHNISFLIPHFEIMANMSKFSLQHS